MSGIEQHPVQAKDRYGNRNDGAKIPKVVALRAYEVYRKVFREQEALITGNCRGGFGVSELIAFLYARSFPEKEWHDRMEEALNGIEKL